MNALQSLWTKPYEANKCGWNSLEDMCACMELSVLLLKKHNQFQKVIFYTDAFGAEVTKHLHHYYDEVHVILDELNWVENWNWAYQKLYVYALQKEPFFHLDMDVFLWDGLPKSWINGEVDFFFQGKEILFPNYMFYKDIYDSLQKYITKEQMPYLPTYAVNCGIAGFNDLSIMPQYTQNALNLIKTLQSIGNSKNWEGKHHNCVLFEQFMLVPLIEGHKNGYIYDDSQQNEIAGVRYTHLVVYSKRIPENIVNVKRILEKQKKRF